MLLFGLSEVWEDTNGCDMQYRCELAIYLMNVLSFSYGIIMDSAKNAAGNAK